MHTLKHTYTDTHTHMHTHIHVHTHTHTHTHTHAHTHTHTHGVYVSLVLHILPVTVKAVHGVQWRRDSGRYLHSFLTSAVGELSEWSAVHPG
jgi:hypothetical protein